MGVTDRSAGRLIQITGRGQNLHGVISFGGKSRGSTEGEHMAAYENGGREAGNQIAVIILPSMTTQPRAIPQ